VEHGRGTSAAATRDDGGADLAPELRLDGSSPHVRIDLHDPTQRLMVETTLCSVPGVIGARIVSGFEREVDELHVLTVVDRSAKQTVRDVQSVLMARFGIPTDHRVVSVVQLEEGRGLPPLTTRPSIDEVGVVRIGTTVQASVLLQDRETSYRGTASGAATLTGRLRSVAHAMLAAVRPMLAEEVQVELEGVQLLDVAGRPLAVAVLQIRTPRTEIILSGSAMVHDTADDAIARAILDGLNRTLADPPD
jgi:hypothetical protein